MVRRLTGKVFWDMIWNPTGFIRKSVRLLMNLQKIGPKLVNLKIKNKTAILYSRDSEFGLSYMPFKDGNAYMEVLRQMHRAAFRQNIGVDFVMAENADFTGYSLLLVPPLYVASDALLNKISAFVKNGGHVIMSVKSGFCDENSVVRHIKAPGPLREAAGFYYQEFSNIKSIPLRDDPFKVGNDKNMAKDWAEFLIPETAKPIAVYDDPFFSRYPAMTENRFGKGSFIYEGCLVTDEVQSKIVSGKALEIGLIDKDMHLSYPIVMKYGTNDQGKTIRYYLNYSNVEQSFVSGYGNGIDLLTNKQLKKGDSITLKPWDLLIVEECFIKNFSKSIHFPKTSIEKGTFANSITKITVNPDGEITEITVINPIDSIIDNEVLRVINLSKNFWKKCDSIRHDQVFYIQIAFSLPGFQPNLCKPKSKEIMKLFPEPIIVSIPESLLPSLSKENDSKNQLKKVKNFRKD